MGIWNTLKETGKNLWEGVKTGTKDLWNLGKSAVKQSKQFFDDGGLESVGKLLKVGEGLGLSKSFSNKVSGGLGRIKDITKKAGDLQQDVDEAMGIGPELG